MTLPEIITYFNNGGSYENFVKSCGFAADADNVALYAQKPFGLNSKIEFFSEGETAGMAEHSYNGSDFYRLFEFTYLLNAIREAGRNELDDIALTLRLLEQAEAADRNCG